MNSKRQNKVSRLVQRELADIFIRESPILFDNAMITVTVVRISPDLSVAKIYLSLFVTKDKAQTLEKIQQRSKNIRANLAQRVRHQMRKIPELIFYEDDSLDYIENIENLLKP